LPRLSKSLAKEQEKRRNQIIKNMKQLTNYLNSLKRRDLAVNTIRNYKYVIKKYLASQELINTANLKIFVQKSLKNLSPATCQENLNILLLYAKYCRITKISKESITRIIPKFQARFFATLTFEDLEKLKRTRFEKNENIWKRNNLILDLLFYSGLRVSELTNLRHSDYVNGLLKILGKGNKYRWVFIPEWIAEKFNPQNTNYFFTNQLRTKIWRHYITGIIHKRTKLAGIKKHLTAHSFRRSFATLLNNNGAKLTSIQKFLGHARLETTANYIHNDQQTLHEDYLKLLKNNPNLTAYEPL